MTARTVDRTNTVPPAKLAHFVLRTGNFEAMCSWYRTGSPDKDPTAAGVDHIAFTFADMGALLGTFARLKASGIEPYWCINHGPTTSLYYRDPDGNQIELQIDNFQTDAELKAFFESGSFAANPIGVAFDPERLVERFENGDSLAELVVQGSA